MANMMPTVYVDTSVFIYLTTPPSKDRDKATRQQITKDWWATKRQKFELFVSQPVYEEFWLPEKVPSEEAHRRFVLLQENTVLLPLWRDIGEILKIAGLLLEPAGPLPRKADVDAIHWAVASYYGCDYLLTWNFKHLNNAQVKRTAERILRNHGYEVPTICSPEELI